MRWLSSILLLSLVSAVTAAASFASAPRSPGVKFQIQPDRPEERWLFRARMGGRSPLEPGRNLEQSIAWSSPEAVSTTAPARPTELENPIEYGR